MTTPNKDSNTNSMATSRKTQNEKELMREIKNKH